MKATKTILCVVLFGLAAISPSQLLGFPLYLTSANGMISGTPLFGGDASSTSSKVQAAPVNLKNILSLVSNTVAKASRTNVPANVKIAYDPFTFTAYLTNVGGYFYNLSGILSLRIDDIATSFRTNGASSNASENDLAIMELDVKGTAPDGSSYEFDIYGLGNIMASLNFSTGSGRLTMSLSNGAGYGQVKDSADGVSKGGFMFMGSGTIPDSAKNQPYSVFWWNNPQ
ncbi:MAG: hypothetical protein C5B50_05810 [Verrucomicrobia bacterium]|nr:MAG: hypothetical protein C5B50_05810 [Verrucomicrobiota bacterium]